MRTPLAVRLTLILLLVSSLAASVSIKTAHAEVDAGLAAEITKATNNFASWIDAYDDTSTLVKTPEYKGESINIQKGLLARTQQWRLITDGFLYDSVGTPRTPINTYASGSVGDGEYLYAIHNWVDHCSKTEADIKKYKEIVDGYAKLAPSVHEADVVKEMKDNLVRIQAQALGLMTDNQSGGMYGCAKAMANMYTMLRDDSKFGRAFYCSASLLALPGKEPDVADSCKNYVDRLELKQIPNCNGSGCAVTIATHVGATFSTYAYILPDHQTKPAAVFLTNAEKALADEKAKYDTLAGKTTTDNAQTAFDTLHSGSVLTLPLPLGGITLPQVIGRIIKQILGIVGALALAFFVFGGFKYMTSRGDEKKVGEAKAMITAAVMGLAAILLSYTILSFIINALQ